MMRRLLTLTFVLSPSLFACSSGTGDIPGPGCTSVQTSTEFTFLSPTPPGATETTLCLPRAPTASTKGEAQCLALHATKAAGAACICPADQGLQPVSAKHKNAVGQFHEGTPSCVCEIKQLTSDDPSYGACTQDPKTPVDAASHPVNGYCYVDGNNDGHNVELVKQCATTPQQAIRFVGRPGTHQTDDLSILVICETDICEEPAE